MNQFKTLAQVLATFSGMLMVATAMLFSATQLTIITNNSIAIENAKFEAEHGIQLQQYGELNTLIGLYNESGIKYLWLTELFFVISIFTGIFAILFAIPRKS